MKEIESINNFIIEPNERNVFLFQTLFLSLHFFYYFINKVELLLVSNFQKTASKAKAVFIQRDFTTPRRPTTQPLLATHRESTSHCTTTDGRCAPRRAETTTRGATRAKTRPPRRRSSRRRCRRSASSREKTPTQLTPAAHPERPPSCIGVEVVVVVVTAAGKARGGVAEPLLLR